MSGGLYAIRPGSAQKILYAGLANESHPLSMEEIYTRLGHIAPSLICKMLKDRVIIGVTLDEICSAMRTCNACEYTKLTYKPTRKIHKPLQHRKLSNEIHINLSKPSPVQTARYNKYYMLYMDNHT